MMGGGGEGGYGRGAVIAGVNASNGGMVMTEMMLMTMTMMHICMRVPCPSSGKETRHQEKRHALKCWRRCAPAVCVWCVHACVCACAYVCKRCVVCGVCMHVGSGGNRSHNGQALM